MVENVVKQGENAESKELALHYMKTLVEVARESFLILDHDLRVISANPIFYQTFRVEPAQTENELLYNLGNGQWDISELKTLLNKILPEKKVVKNYEVSHDFETIGPKTMILNGQQIDSVQMIILAIEDITSRKQLETKVADYTNELEATVAKRTSELNSRIEELERVNKMMVGREIKMIELKNELSKLKESRKS